MMKQIRGMFPKAKVVGFLICCVAFAYNANANYKSPFPTDAKDKEITGNVVDDQGIPLPGASIVIKGTMKGTSADFDGNFTLQVPEGDAVLVISYLGYKTQEVSVGTSSHIMVQMEPEANSLEGVMVVGYGKQKVKDLTGSVGFVNESVLKESSVPTVSQALQGKVAGVQITADSGEPGGGIAVRIRGTGTFGNNDPLYVIDGFPTKSGISSVNPSDIASISILKDAAASAIYGARAANGVIIITTKKGKAGVSKINIESYYGFQQAANQIDVLNSHDYVMITKEAYRNSGLPDDEFWGDPSEYGPGTANPTDTNWQDEVFRNAPIQNHQFTFSGGSEKSDYLFSLGYYGLEGIVVGSGFERISARINGSTKFSDKFKVGTNLSLTTNTQDVVPDDHSWTSVLFGALRERPMVPVKDANGDWGGNIGPAEYVGDGGNPLRLALLNYDSRKSYRVLGNSYLEYKPFKDFTFKSSFGYDFLYSKGKDFDPTYTEGSSQAIQNQLSETSSIYTTWVWENTLNYTFDLGEDHHFDVLAGITKEENRYETLNASRKDFPNNQKYIWYLDAGTGTRDNSGGTSEYALMSYLGRLNYNFKNRYLFQANVRRDGSSRFGESNRFGTFPSVSAGWIMSEEGFYDNTKTFNYVKLRASYGKLGNQDIYSNYPWANNLDLVYYPFGTSQATVPGYAPNAASNPDVTWETTIQSNFGLDLKLFDSSVSLTADYFIKDTEDMLLTLPAPATSGYSTTAYTNVGKIRNSGIELALDYQSPSDKAFTYNIGGNFTKIRNEVKDLGSVDYIWSDQAYLGERWTRTEVGKPISQFFGYVADGLFQNDSDVAAHGMQPDAKPGDIRFVDVNEDGVLDDKDRTYIGDPNPDFTFSAYAQTNYKNVDFSVRLYGSYGNDIYNGMIRQIETASEPYNKWSNILNRWTGEGTSNSVPRVTRDDVNQNTRSSSRMIEDGSFIRIKNVQLGYSLPKSVLEKLKVDRLRFYVSAENLHTFTSYRGYDPEMYQTKGSRTDLGVDRAKYPVASSLVLGVNLSL
ncbi:TonB-linked outer membrane protein, SusC/RagA family [Zobellia uliginosa]|uniref:TonB-linked outer membrane protein, SusC/RagA family n=1 Tax=Zobellia uliginosa TaxID=143224 RepID=A0ABY1L1T2_9FLAO|nr:TonB-dependent receptor [Zobellia uliginosa]SIT08555.1 TonB-linked outer membrane protein, SusC/RagA family [Zobellia uliginosa]